MILIGKATADFRIVPTHNAFSRCGHYARNLVLSEMKFQLDFAFDLAFLPRNVQAEQVFRVMGLGRGFERPTECRVGIGCYDAAGDLFGSIDTIFSVRRSTFLNPS